MLRSTPLNRPTRDRSCPQYVTQPPISLSALGIFSLAQAFATSDFHTWAVTPRLGSWQRYRKHYGRCGKMPY